MLDSYGKPFSDLHKVMGHMAVNDFSIGMPSDYAVEFKTLADSVNTVRTRSVSAQDALHTGDQCRQNVESAPKILRSDASSSEDQSDPKEVIETSV